MRGGRHIRFGDFELDRVEGRLRRDGTEIHLRAKSFALLRYLAENSGRLITRDELLGAVWPDTTVIPNVVRMSIRELRETLGEDSTAPRFIETVGRQGYRFLSAMVGAAPVAPPTFIGRETELARLHELLDRCRRTRHQTAFIAGEAGMGKTALVEHFVEEVQGARLARIGVGQCVDLHGPTEPYLPVLEMLGRLCREQDHDDVVKTLERWAPSWLLQMGGVIDAEVADRLRRRVPNPTRERMLRELADATEILSRATPLLLIFEDLHWSDASTIDLLVYLAERVTPARLLVLATYRPVEAVVRNHPLRTRVRDLLARGRGVEIVLDLLTLQEVEIYLAHLFQGSALDPALAATMHAKTDGNPLFLAAIIEYLLDRRLLAISDGRWQLAADADTVPPTIRELVAREIETLSSDDQAMLSAASVIGLEVDAITVSAAAEQTLRHVEDRLAELAAQSRLVRAIGTTTWPDGSLGGTYRFLHALHRDAVYERLSPAERARLHGLVGERIEVGWRRDPSAVAALLASHFERASDWQRAIRHHLVAVATSKARLADHEVAAHCESVLSLLAHLPKSTESEQTEMTCSLDLGASLLAVRGYGAPEVEPLFARACDLALALEQPMVEIMARGGLYIYQVMGGDQRRALRLANDLLAMSERFPLPLFVTIGHTTVACSSYNLGDFVGARSHFERARQAWEPGFPRMQLDQRIMFLGLGALTLQILEEDQEAAEWRRALIEHVNNLDDPLNVAHGCELLAGICRSTGERAETIAWAERALQLSMEHGFPARAALSKITKGHALGDLALQREGFAALQVTGHRVGMPVHRLGMAETLIAERSWNEARVEIDLALAAIDATGEARHLAEAHRIRGAWARAVGDRDEAVAALEQAVAVAREQKARCFERRAQSDLASL